ncbi:MAG: hypothetical protein N2C14_30280 [Planctomycetales bacterium]
MKRNAFLIAVCAALNLSLSLSLARGQGLTFSRNDGASDAPITSSIAALVIRGFVPGVGIYQDIHPQTIISDPNEAAVTDFAQVDVGAGAYFAKASEMALVNGSLLPDDEIVSGASAIHDYDHFLELSDESNGVTRIDAVVQSGLPGAIAPHVWDVNSTLVDYPVGTPIEINGLISVSWNHSEDPEGSTVLQSVNINSGPINQTGSARVIANVDSRTQIARVTIILVNPDGSVLLSFLTLDWMQDGIEVPFTFQTEVGPSAISLTHRATTTVSHVAAGPQDSRRAGSLAWNFEQSLPASEEPDASFSPPGLTQAADQLRQNAARIENDNARQALENAADNLDAKAETGPPGRNKGKK